MYCKRQSVSYKPALILFSHPKQSVLCQTALFSHEEVLGRELHVMLLARPKGNRHSWNRHLSIRSRKSTPPQNRQLDMFISDGKQQVDDFMGELTF